jgi:hypothetical protein
MSWLESLTSKVKSAVAPVLQSPPARMAGRALESTYTRPMIGFKPEIAGIIASELLPKENAGKHLLDAALYLASGPLNTSLGLAGSTPQGDDPYFRWKQLGYTSREDMVNRVAAQQSLEAARERSVYTADDYGPPRPVRYPGGDLVIGDYVVKRFDTPAADRPSGSDTVPVPNLPKKEQTRAAVENELLEQAAKTERTSELLRQMVELGVTGGMSADNMREWVGANQGLAENLIRDRLGRKERLAKEFA